MASRFIVGAVPTAVTEAIPAGREFSIDVRVLAFTAGIAMATSLLFAVIPLGAVAPRSRRARPSGGVALDTGTATAPHTSWPRRVHGHARLAASYWWGPDSHQELSALMATDAGFNPDRVLTASLTLPRAGYSTAASVRSFQRALFTRASTLPGVRSAALVTDLPFERYEDRVLSAEGVKLPDGTLSDTNLSWVYGPYVQTLGIRLQSGRVFSEVEAHRVSAASSSSTSGWRGPSGRDRMPSASACAGGSTSRKTRTPGSP